MYKIHKRHLYILGNNYNQFIKEKRLSYVAIYIYIRTLAFSHVCVYYYTHVYYTYGVQGL